MSGLRFHSPGSRWHGSDVSGGMPDRAIGEADTIGLIDDSVETLVDDAQARHHAPNVFGSRITILVAPAPPPRDHRQQGALVQTFLASGRVAQHIARCSASPADWCFEALRFALAGPRQTTDIQVVDRRDMPAAQRNAATCETVFSHRGPERYLRLCMDGLLRQTMPTSVSVGIDQKYRCPRFLDDIRARDEVSVFGVDPHPVGPFVAMHVLGARAHSDYIMRQDSDDFSLPERAATLSAASRDLGAGLVGSHMLTLDEIDRKVIPTRFPPDANHALRASGADHHLFLATSICSRDGWAASEGFSTYRIFAHNVDHWLRASFRVPIRNVDAFLYIRRRHERSLTTRADIGMTSAPRLAARDAWRADFLAVSAGEKAIEATSLALRHRVGSVRFTDLKRDSTQDVVLDDVHVAARD